MAWVTEWLGPLLRYDASNRMPLVPTLRQFFASNANVKDTARKLYTHANTITYRLEKIESLVRVDPRNVAATLPLQLGLKLYDWVGCETGRLGTEPIS